MNRYRGDIVATRSTQGVIWYAYGKSTVEGKEDRVRGDAMSHPSTQGMWMGG